MKLTVIGCGDAFGSGGRFNTCFTGHLSSANLKEKRTLFNVRRMMLTHT